MVKITDESRAVLRTSLGNMTLAFISDKAPRTAENFAKLAQKGFYDGLTFHRVLKDFMVQGGCPKGNGSGGPGYTIRPEFNDTPHVKGTVSMARSNDPHSAGSQFFIVHGEARYLDSRYTAFAKLVDGEEVLDKIAGVPTNMEMRFNEQSVPRDPVYINGVDLEGVDFDPGDLDDGKSAKAEAPADDGAAEESDGDDESGAKAEKAEKGDGKPRSRRGGGRKKKAEGDDAKAEEAGGDAEAKPARKKATRKKATRKAAGSKSGGRKKTEKKED